MLKFKVSYVCLNPFLPKVHSYHRIRSQQRRHGRRLSQSFFTKGTFLSISTPLCGRNLWITVSILFYQRYIPIRKEGVTSFRELCDQSQSFFTKGTFLSKMDNINRESVKPKPVSILFYQRYIPIPYDGEESYDIIQHVESQSFFTKGTFLYQWPRGLG